MSQSASAACYVDLESHNISQGDVTVNWELSDVRRQVTVAGQVVPGAWTTLGNYETPIVAGDTINTIFVAPGACAAVNRQYRLYVTDAGGNSYFTYFPSPQTWTQNITPHIHPA